MLGFCPVLAPRVADGFEPVYTAAWRRQVATHDDDLPQER